MTSTNRKPRTMFPFPDRRHQLAILLADVASSMHDADHDHQTCDAPALSTGAAMLEAETGLTATQATQVSEEAEYWALWHQVNRDYMHDR